MPEVMGSTISQMERMETARRRERAERTTRPDGSKSLREPCLQIPTSVHEPETHRRAVGPTNITSDANTRALLNEYEKQAVRLTRSDPEQPAAPPRPQEDNALSPSTQKFNSISQTHQPLLDPPLLKRINHFARQHKFFTEQSLHEYTTSQRRSFERAVYDYARSIKLSKAQAQASIIHARSMCGEENYDSDDTRPDDDEVDDSTAVGVGLLSSENRCSSAAQTRSPQYVQMQPKASTPENENTRKRPSDASDNGSGKRRKSKRMKTTKVAMNGAQAKSQGPRVIVTWIEIKRKLLTSFENAALHFHQWPVIDPMEEKIIESIRYAANRLTFEVMEDRPVLLQWFSEAFKGGTMEYFGKYPKSKVKTLRHEQNLRSTLNTHIDAAMARRIEEKHRYGRVSDQCSEDSDDQSGSSRQSTPESSWDNPTESNASIDYGYDDQSATSGVDRPDIMQQYNSEGVETADSYVTATTGVQNDIEQKLVTLIQDLSQKYSHNQLTDETKALLRTAFKTYEKHHASENEREHDRLLLQKWGDLIRNDSADGSEVFGASQDLDQASGTRRDVPFVRFSNIGNAWRPWSRHEPTNLAVNLNVSLSDVGEALNDISNTTAGRVEEEIGPDDIQLSEDEQSMQVPESEGNGDAKSDEQPLADGIVAVKEETQNIVVKREEPESSDNLVQIPTGPPLVGVGQRDPQQHPIPHSFDKPPVMSQCHVCGRWFPSKGARLRHHEFFHGQATTRYQDRDPDKEYRLWLQEEANPYEAESNEIPRRAFDCFEAFLNPDDPARVTAAGEEVPGQQVGFVGLRLRGGGAAELHDAACDSSRASSLEIDDNICLDTMDSGCDSDSSKDSSAGLDSSALLTSKVWALVDIVQEIKRALAAESSTSGQIGPSTRPVSSPIVSQVSSTSSSPLSSAPSSPIWPTPGGIIRPRDIKWGEELNEELSEEHGIQSTPSKLRRSWSKTSPYFLPTPKVPREAVSCIPFPPLSSTSFGLVQESLAPNPFHLLIAVIFLNKTRGAVALPVFYNFITRFPTPSSLAAANIEEVVGFFQNLGLQNQRAKKCVALAKSWLQHPPTEGKRWRKINYPSNGDGKDIKSSDEPIADEVEDARVAWEVGHLPGIGAYGIDSWRIFCRDALRGLGTSALPDFPAEGDEVSKKTTEEAELRREWTRVLPLDKELRAYLRWRWMRLGWEWDPKTGERKRADARIIDEAAGGGTFCEGEQGWSMNGENGHDEIRKMGSLY